MRSNHTFGIQFVLRPTKIKGDDQFVIYARISVDGKRTEVSLKKRVDPGSWDSAKGKARGTKDEARKINAHIERIRTLIADGYHQLVQDKKTVNVDTVKALFTGWLCRAGSFWECGA